MLTGVHQTENVSITVKSRYNGPLFPHWNGPYKRDVLIMKLRELLVDANKWRWFELMKIVRIKARSVLKRSVVTIFSVFMLSAIRSMKHVCKVAGRCELHVSCEPVIITLLVGP
jgi:hypothetical protein